MQPRTLGTAAAAGVAAFLVAFVAVTELLSDVVEFSVFLGIPAGLLVGIVAAAVVLATADRTPGSTSRALGRALGWFGLALLLGLLGGVLLFDRGIAVSLLGGAILGIVAGIAVFLRSRQPGAPGT